MCSITGFDYTDDPARLWRRTVWDFRRTRWRTRANQLDEAKRLLELQVLRARRDPTEAERDRNDYRGFQQRLGRCTAFGQFAEEVDPARQKVAQMGLLGTSAAFQVLSGSEWLQPHGTGGAPQEAKTRWLDSYLHCLNFIDLVVHPLEDEPDGELWKQRRLTLRICGLMRASAAGARVLETLAETQLEPVQQKIVTNDLSEPLDKIARHHIHELSRLLLKCRLPARDIENGWRAGASDIEHSYAFAATTAYGPTTPDEWVFMWGTVIAASVRCYRQGLMPEKTLQELCPAADMVTFERVLKQAPTDLDRRFKLFGLWALSQFDEAPGSMAVTPLPEYVALDDEKREWLAQEVASVAVAVLSEQLSLVDSWLPYWTYMGSPTKLADDGAETADNPAGAELDRMDYREDVMVVPVVPVLLGLLATYRRARLCRKVVLHLLLVSVDPALRRDLGRAKPFQLDRRDGVVNLGYWQETYLAAADACRRMGGDAPRRAWWLVSGTVRDFGRLASLAVLVALTTVAYVAFAASEGVVSGVLFGVLASVLAAVISPGLVRYIWGHRDL